MSSSRHGTPLMAYSLSPERNRMRVSVTSLNSTGSSPAELSSVRLTSARPNAARFSVPAKITSSIFCERTDLGAWAPSTQAIASTTFDLPDPFGPTTTVTPVSRFMTVESANDLKPLRVRLLRNTLPEIYSALTARAVMGGTLGRHGSPDPADAARRAAFARSPVHDVGVLVRAPVAEQIDVLGITQRRAAVQRSLGGESGARRREVAARKPARVRRTADPAAAAPRAGSRRRRCCRSRRSRADRAATV